MNLFIQLQLNGLINSSMYALIAIAFGIIYRTTGIFHIALGGLYVIAAYITYTLIGLGIIPSILIAILVTAMFSIIMEIGIYKPMYKKQSPSSVILIASLGIYIIIENSIALIYGNQIKILSQDIEPSFDFANIIITRMQIIQLLLGISCILLFIYGIKKIKTFKTIWAIGENTDLANAMGIPIFNLRIIAFIMSGIFIAISSILTSYDIGTDPHVGMSAFLIGAVAVLVGGKNNPIGWILSAFIISFFQSIAIWKFSAQWNDTVTYIILILVLLLKPSGLFTKKGRDDA